MKESTAWLDLGNQSNQQATPTKPIITSTEKTVQDIIDMLKVAHEQSEIEWKTLVTSYFSKSNGIISHLIRTGKIANISQADELRLKVMKLLNIPEDDTYSTIKKLSNKNTTLDENGQTISPYRNRLDTSLWKIIDHINSHTIAQSIDDCWNTTDKKYFKPHVTNKVEYTKIIKTYFFQKYGMEFTEENVKKIQEK